MTKIHCLNGINISEIPPSPSPIIYILEQENSKLLKDIILPLHSAYLQRNILLKGKKARLVTIISGRHPRRVANLFFINAKDKLKKKQQQLTDYAFIFSCFSSVHIPSECSNENIKILAIYFVYYHKIHDIEMNWTLKILRANDVNYLSALDFKNINEDIKLNISYILRLDNGCSLRGYSPSPLLRIKLFFPPKWI